MKDMHLIVIKECIKNVLMILSKEPSPYDYYVVSMLIFAENILELSRFLRLAIYRIVMCEGAYEFVIIKKEKFVEVR